jgi:hypothetical protein
LSPAGLTPAEAAAIPVPGLSALHALRDHGRVRPGQAVLVVGASGGVGSFAVRIARLMGARVTGVCRPGKADFAHALGAGDVIDNTMSEITDTGRRWEVILDIGGGRPLRVLHRALAPHGTLVIVGAEGGGRTSAGVGRGVRAALLSPVLPGRMRMRVSRGTRADLEVLRDLEAGRVQGKVVFSPDGVARHVRRPAPAPRANCSAFGVPMSSEPWRCPRSRVNRAGLPRRTHTSSRRPENLQVPTLRRPGSASPGERSPRSAASGSGTSRASATAVRGTRRSRTRPASRLACVN